MDKLQFYPIDSTYKIVDEKAQIQIFGKTLDNKQICIVDDSLRPYFYVLLKNEKETDSFVSKITKISVEDKDREAKVVDAEVVDKNFLGKSHKVAKVYTQIPADVPLIRNVIKEWDMIQSIHEYDIPFTRRYFIDKKITPLTVVEVEGKFVTAKSRVPCFLASSISQFSTDSMEKPKILAFDIETYNPTGRNFQPEKHPILMIAFYEEGYRKVITWKKFKTDLDYIEFVDGEADLLNRFKQIVTRHSPDIITGYFSDKFDFPYIIERAKKYKIDLDLGLDHSTVGFRKGKTEIISLTGIVHLDVYRFILKILGRSLDTDSYSLDNVSKELLGEEKDGVDIEKLSSAWDSNEGLETYCKYNLQDAHLTFRLCEKIIPNIFELVKIVGQPIKEISAMSFSQLVEWYIMRKIQEFNEIAPNRPSHFEIEERMSKRYEGAFVYEPNPGLYKNIAVFDFRSLYPTIISSHNICLSTIRDHSGPGRELAPVEDEKYYFSSSKKGFLPLIIEDLITHRMRIKEILKNSKDPLLEARSDSLKLLANSFYGYLGFYAARWYSWECASSVTAFGRYHIKEVIEEAKKSDFDVIYGDTDSIFLNLKDQDKKEAIKFVERINSKLPGLMELEYEGTFPAGIFVAAKEGKAGAKKKYALLDDKGKVKIKGFETVRRNWSFIAKEVQENVLNIVLRENDLPKAVKYVKVVISDLKEKKIENSKLEIHTQLTKPIESYNAIGPHVAVARRLKSQGVEVVPGMIIKYVITAGKGVLRDRAKTLEEIEQGEYDAEYYITHQIVPSVERIFDALGYDKEDLISDKKQTGLGDYF